MDLTVGAIPGFAATIVAERKWLAKRAKSGGPTPADYEPNDARASLTMGALSLLAPFVLPRLVAPFAPKRKLGKTVLRTAVAAAIITTVADQIERRYAHADNNISAGALAGHTRRTGWNRDRRRVGLSNAARRVRSVAAPASLIAGGLAATGAWRSFTSRQQLFAHRLLPDMGSGPAQFAVAMLGWDFIYYWNHRFMHEARYMWAIHVVHHSSEHYNLSTALRQPVADVFGTFIPDGLMCTFGLRPALVEQSRAINLLYQYWIHTDTIRTLGPFEYLFNTPSHHRVHHGRNPKYIDKNHAGSLIIWDKMFGTFQPERENETMGG